MCWYGSASYRNGFSLFLKVVSDTASKAFVVYSQYSTPTSPHCILSSVINQEEMKSFQSIIHASLFTNCFTYQQYNFWLQECVLCAAKSSFMTFLLAPPAYPAVFRLPLNSTAVTTVLPQTPFCCNSSGHSIQKLIILTCDTNIKQTLQHIHRTHNLSLTVPSGKKRTYL